MAVISGIWSIVFIALCGAMAIVYYYKKNRNLKYEDEYGTLACNEVERSGKPSLMIIKDMGDEAVAKVNAFIHDNTDMDFDTHCKLERDGNVIRLTMDKDTDFYDVACMVNEFAWDAEGLAYCPKAQYHIRRVTIGQTELRDMDVVFYIREGEEDPVVVYFATQDGREYRYDLSNMRVKPM